MGYIYYKLFKVFKSDYFAKLIVMSFVYFPLDYILRRIIISFYGNDYFVNLRESGFYRFISIIPLIVIGVIVSVYFNDKRVNKIKEKYGNG